MKTLITAFLFCPKISRNLLLGNMKRSKFSTQKTTPEQEVLETLITKHHASDNGEQREAASLVNKLSISNDA